MRHFYKTASVLILVLTLTCLSGCKAVGVLPDSSDKLSVVSTIFASYDFARQIAGDEANVTMLLKPGAESHSYEPAPRDIITIQECDVFIYVGGENDAWVDNILASMDTSEITIIKMLDLVDKYEEEHVEGMESHEHTDECGHDHDSDDETDDHAEWDEHVWTSPVNAITICEALTEAFIETDDGNADVYKQNALDYIEELKELDASFRKVVENGNRNTLIFGDRFPLRYFVEEYGLEYYAAFPGCSSDTEASAATVAFLIDKVRDENISVVLKIELSSESMASTIAEDTDTMVLTFNTCHNITRDEFEAGETYVSLMYKNVEVLKEALK